MVEILPGDLAHGHHVAGARGLGDQRLEAREVELLVDVVIGALVGHQLDPVVATTLTFEKAPGFLIRREYARGRAEFGAHVGEHMSVHGAQAG